MLYYLNYFFIFSIFGNFIERFFYHDSASGILFGPWTHIYGFGALAILLINHFFIKKLKLSIIPKIIITFLIGAIVLSIVEAIGGYYIEWVFGFSFWDYTHAYRFNIGKYVALEKSFLWGVSALGIVYIFKPLIDKFIEKIPKYFTYAVLVLFIIDNILTNILKR